MKPNLISGTYTSAGTVGVIYADTTEDLAMDEYIGVDKRQLACGSVAYLKNQEALVMDSTGHWTTDSEDAIPNKEKNWFIPMQIVTLSNLSPMVSEQTFVGTSPNPFYSFHLDGEGVEMPNEAQIIFDGVTYNLPKKNVDIVVQTMDYYGATIDIMTNPISVDFDECPFFLAYWNYESGIFNHKGWWVVVNDAESHTIKADGYYNFSHGTLANVSPIHSDNATVIYNGEKYEGEWDGGFGTDDWYIYGSPTDGYEIEVYNSYGGEVEVGAYEILSDDTVYKVIDNLTFTAEDDGESQYEYVMSPIPMFRYVDITYDGETMSGEAQFDDDANVHFYGDPTFEYAPYAVKMFSIDVQDGNAHTISVIAYDVSRTSVIKNGKVAFDGGIAEFEGISFENPYTVLKGSFELMGLTIPIIGTATWQGQKLTGDIYGMYMGQDMPLGSFSINNSGNLEIELNVVQTGEITATLELLSNTP